MFLALTYFQPIRYTRDGAWAAGDIPVYAGPVNGLPGAVGQTKCPGGYDGTEGTTPVPGAWGAFPPVARTEASRVPFYVRAGNTSFRWLPRR